MKMSKNKRRQQQGGKPVLVTFYVAQPRDRDGRGSTSTASSSSHALGHHHHHKQQRQDHHNSHGGGPEMQRRRRNDGKSQRNRRADLLEYSQHLRASARQTAPTTATESSTPPPPPRKDTTTPRKFQAVGVHRDKRQPQQAAVNRPERAMSQQEIRQRCFGRDDWSWKRLLVLVFPFHMRPRRSNRDDSEKNVNINQTGRPAAWLVGKLTVSKDRRERSGFLKTLMSSFKQRPR